MNKKLVPLVQLCWLLIGIIFLGAGIFAYTQPNKDIVSFSRVLGVAMLLAGGLNYFVCYKKSHLIHGVRWLEADGLCAMLLSIFPLFNDMVFPNVIPFFFGVWELFSGILKALDTQELKHEGINCWKGFAVISSIELISGTASLLKPVEIAVGFNHVIGIVFLVQSMGFFLKTIMYKELISQK